MGQQSAPVNARSTVTKGLKLLDLCPQLNMSVLSSFDNMDSNPLSLSSCCNDAKANASQNLVQPSRYLIATSDIDRGPALYILLNILINAHHGCLTLKRSHTHSVRVDMSTKREFTVQTQRSIIN